MRGPLIHGVLLAVMLVYGYRTWTRDKTSEPSAGNVVLWDKSEADLVSIEYKAPKKILKIERKPGGQAGESYWWGSDTTIEMKPKAKPASGSGSGSGSGAGAGSGSGSGSAATPPPPPPPEEEEVSRKTHEFPLGDPGDKLIKDYSAARALRDLGVPSVEQKKDFKLIDAKTTLTLTFKDGAKTFLVGGPVYGGSDRYVADQASGHAYVLAKDLIAGLDTGETALHLTDPRGFDAAKMDAVTIEAGGKQKTVVRFDAEQDGTKRKTWADAETKTPNTLAANFVDGVNNLRPTEYATTLKASDMTPVLRLTYKNDKGATLGTLQLLRYEKPGQLAPEQELDPANPPKGETEYYILTEKTRVPGLVRKDTAQRTEGDIENLFSGKTEPTGSGSGSGKSPGSIDPHGNPLGSHPGMVPNEHAGPGGSAPPVDPMPGMPHGGATPPAPPVRPSAGSAAPAPAKAQAAGSAAAPATNAPPVVTPLPPAPKPAAAAGSAQ